jgi:sec-independent protein translocase protein TatB
MFNIGWAELLVILVVAVIVIGPKELPVAMRALGRIVRRLQYMRYAMSQQFEDFLQQQDLNELRRDANFFTNPVASDASRESKNLPENKNSAFDEFNEAEEDENYISLDYTSKEQPPITTPKQEIEDDGK